MRGPQRAEFCALVERSADTAEAWAGTEAELEQALGDLDAVLAAGDGHVRLSDEGEIVVSPLSAESVPAEADILRGELM